MLTDFQKRVLQEELRHPGKRRELEAIFRKVEREKFERENPDKKRSACLDCGYDSGRYYESAEVWAATGLGPLDGRLCLDCLACRLGRSLRLDDFPDDAPFNREDLNTAFYEANRCRELGLPVSLSGPYCTSILRASEQDKYNSLTAEELDAMPY